MTFMSPLIIEPCNDCDCCCHMFELREPFRYLVNRSGMRAIITVPAGFRTDFASIPRMLWPILPPHGKYSRAAVVHDYLYSIRGKASRALPYTRAECDEIFLIAMAELGVSWATRWVMYLGVRLGGWWGWWGYSVN